VWLLLPVLGALVGLYHLHLFLAGHTQLVHTAEPLDLWHSILDGQGWRFGPQAAHTGFHTSSLYYFLQLPVLLFDNMNHGVHVLYALIKFACIGLWLWWGSRRIERWPLVWISAVLLAVDEEAPGFHYENQTLACYISLLLFMAVVTGIRSRRVLALAPAGILFAVVKEVHVIGLAYLPCVLISLCLGRHDRARNSLVFLVSAGAATLVILLSLGGYTYAPVVAGFDPLPAGESVSSMLGALLRSIRFELYGPLALGGLAVSSYLLIRRRELPGLVLHAMVWLPLLHVCLSAVSVARDATLTHAQCHQNRWFAFADGPEAVLAAFAVYFLVLYLCDRLARRQLPSAVWIAGCMALGLTLCARHGVAVLDARDMDARTSSVLRGEHPELGHTGVPWRWTTCKNARILDDLFFDPWRSDAWPGDLAEDVEFHGLCQDTVSDVLRWYERSTRGSRWVTPSTASSTTHILLLPRLGAAEDRLLPAARHQPDYTLTVVDKPTYFQIDKHNESNPVAFWRADLGDVAAGTVVLQTKTSLMGLESRSANDAWLELEGGTTIPTSLIQIAEGTHWLFFEIDPRVHAPGRAALVLDVSHFPAEGLGVFTVPSHPR